MWPHFSNDGSMKRNRSMQSNSGGNLDNSLSQSLVQQGQTSPMSDANTSDVSENTEATEISPGVFREDGSRDASKRRKIDLLLSQTTLQSQSQLRTRPKTTTDHKVRSRNERLLEDLLPSDDFGSIRERRDFSPLQVCRWSILPNPYRDQVFASLTGWRYCPSGGRVDRLGFARTLDGMPSTEMAVPASWREGNPPQFQSGDCSSLESLRSTPMKRISASYHTNESSGMNAMATVVTASTSQTDRTNTSVVSQNIIPKAELHSFYGKLPGKVRLASTAYVTWDNQNPKATMYTAAFVCPITKEVFLAGRHGEVYHSNGPTSMTWYPRKVQAEHAAAARALDCWYYRESSVGKPYVGHDDPYSVQNAPRLPKTLFPPSILSTIEKLRQLPGPRDSEATTTPVDFLLEEDSNL